jgi:CO/xanthine dehydrogenase FAD-binding subunit
VCRKLYGGALAEAAANIGSTPLRNLITVGGASFQVMPWSDLPGVLLAMDAAFLVKSTSGAERMVPAQTLFARQPRTVLSPSELLVEVQIPIPELAHLGAYQKVAKTRVDYAALTVTVTLLMRQDLVVDARVVVGAAKALPTRLQQAEQVLVNQAPNRQLFVKAASIAAGALEPVRDIRYSALYKKHLTKIWVRRCLERALKLNQGGTYAD